MQIKHRKEQGQNTTQVFKKSLCPETKQEQKDSELSKTSDLKKKKTKTWGTWVAQSVKHLTLDFGSGRDLKVHGIKSQGRFNTDNTGPAWDSLSPSLSAPPPLAHKCACSLLLKINT